MSVGADYVELLGLVFYCSVNDKGISTDELSRHLKLPMDKILYTSSPSLTHTHADARAHTHTHTMMMHVGVTYSYILLFYDRDGIRSLEEEGAIYSTIDDSHFKAT